jgi:hypothetical protein
MPLVNDEDGNEQHLGKQDGQMPFGKYAEDVDSMDEQ